MTRSFLRLLRPIKRSCERTFAIRILKTLPRGFDFLYDVRQLLPDPSSLTIFDIGANVGQSAIPFATCFTGSEIYCFEPSVDNFRALSNVTDGYNNIHIYHHAAGNVNGQKTLLLDKYPTRHKISITIDPEQHTEQVDMVTLDSFCEQYGIKGINILKIDTEGYDLEVLRGATQLLSNQSIDVAYVEVGMNPTNDLHVRFDVMRAFLENLNYSLFGIYEQKYEWKLQKPYLRRANVAFVSSRVGTRQYKQREGGRF